jgi:drug/metabolite transporter (DMT)-like permease
MILQPVLTALLALVFAGESLAPLQLMGGLAAMGGIYLVNISRG